MKRWLAPLVLLICLAAWPLTYCYTSFGIDHDARQGDKIETTFYRLRWPGDGVMFVGYLVELYPDRGKPLEPFDLGGRFFHPPKSVAPVTFANRLGFWWVNVDRNRGDAESPVTPGAQRAMLMGLPHWLIVTLALVWCLWSRRVSQKKAAAPAAVVANDQVAKISTKSSDLS